MHATEGETEGITFSHNGDFSGEVIISIDTDATWEYKRDEAVTLVAGSKEYGIPDSWDIRIPFEDLKLLVAKYVRMKKISALEEANDDSIIGSTCS